MYSIICCCLFIRSADPSNSYEILQLLFTTNHTNVSKQVASVSDKLLTIISGSCEGAHRQEALCLLHRLIPLLIPPLPTTTLAAGATAGSSGSSGSTNSSNISNNNSNSNSNSNNSISASIVGSSQGDQTELNDPPSNDANNSRQLPALHPIYPSSSSSSSATNNNANGFSLAYSVVSELIK